MGMRAGISYIHADGTADLMTLQWSVYLDGNVQQILRNLRKENKGKHSSTLLRNLIADLTSKYEHASSLDAESEPLRKDDYRTEVRTENFVLTGECEHTDETVKFCKGQKLTYGQIADQTLDGGSIGLIYDEREPRNVTFIYFSDEGDRSLVLKTMSVANLVNKHEMSDFSDLRRTLS